MAWLDWKGYRDPIIDRLDIGCTDPDHHLLLHMGYESLCTDRMAIFGESRHSGMCIDPDDHPDGLIAFLLLSKGMSVIRLSGDGQPDFQKQNRLIFK